MRLLSIFGGGLELSSSLFSSLSASVSFFSLFFLGRYLISRDGSWSVEDRITAKAELTHLAQLIHTQQGLKTCVRACVCVLYVINGMELILMSMMKETLTSAGQTVPHSDGFGGFFGNSDAGSVKPLGTAVTPSETDTHTRRSHAWSCFTDRLTSFLTS